MKKSLLFTAALTAAVCLAEDAAPAAPKADAPSPAAASMRHARRMPRLDRPSRGIYEGPHGMRRMPGLVVSDFGVTADGRKAKLFRIMGQGGIVADFSDHGARLVRLYLPDRDGNLADVTVGFNDVSGYEKYDRNFNSTVGRFANRIAAGKFSLDGQDYQLPLNWGPEDKRCCLHGGTNAMNFAIWKARPVRRPRPTGMATGVEFIYESPDGDQGFPGAMTVKVTHWITAKNVWNTRRRSRARLVRSTSPTTPTSI